MSTATAATAATLTLPEFAEVAPEDAALFAAMSLPVNEGNEGPDTETELLPSPDCATMVEYDPATGEVLRDLEAPEETAEALDIAEHVGPRLRGAEARLAGLQAERAAHLAKIEAHYGPLIRREESLIGHYKAKYHDALRRFAEAAGLLAPGAPKRSIKLGLLTLGFQKKPARIDVADEALAVTWAKIACPDAVKIKESVLVSRIPADMDLPPAASGMVRVAPHDVFEVK